MRKLKKIIILVGICLLFATGCTGKTKTMVCTRNANQNGMKVELRYEVEYTKNTVNKVSSTEKIISESKDILETYKKTVEATYSPYKDVEHYNYEVSIDGNTLTSVTEIDYSQIDTDKLMEIDSANGALIKDGKINIDDLRSAYESIGTTCEK